MKRNKSTSVLSSHLLKPLELPRNASSSNLASRGYSDAGSRVAGEGVSPLLARINGGAGAGTVFNSPAGIPLDSPPFGGGNDASRNPSSPSSNPPPSLSYYTSSNQYYSTTDPTALLHAYQRVLNHLHSMQRRLDSLEHHIHGIANESSHLKYSRRLLQVSNIVLALYIALRTLRLFWIRNAKELIWSFWSEYALSVGTKKDKKEGIIRAFLRRRAKAALQNAASDSPMKKFSLRGVQILIVTWFGPPLIRIILLVFSTYWLQKMEIWKRRVGVWISFISNVHVALTTDVSPWTIYFNIFTLLTYITTRNYQHMIPQKIDRYVDYGIRSLATPTRRFIHHQRQKSSPGKMQQEQRKDKERAKSSLTNCATDPNPLARRDALRDGEVASNGAIGSSQRSCIDQQDGQGTTSHTDVSSWKTRNRTEEGHNQPNGTDEVETK
eukprot:CAMPEP_0117442292 /NCGR_PEP_ID=MMETSP0759-20121206/4075_1 /TAXON_ID=63605 /ORGANISM="Percolomonas cosmopolitus, Strain WS" /LENGTH=438 /DNA_ID=CAMNT_0005234173 /DNA_START=91 /DNA_END=1407 /DNA_ORIENTATION=-